MIFCAKLVTNISQLNCNDVERHLHTQGSPEVSWMGVPLKAREGRSQRKVSQGKIKLAIHRGCNSAWQ